MKAAIGVRAVIDLLAAARKPLVGHNMLLDLLHTLQSFNAPLPVSYLEFKRRIAQLFPLLFDTKFIAEQEAFHNRFKSGPATAAAAPNG